MNSWITTTIDDACISATPIEPILTIERSGNEYGDVIIHKSAEELEAIMRDHSGTLGGLARLALEILNLRTYEAKLRAALEQIADPSKLDACNAPMPPKDARLALSWLSARPEFKAAREVLARLHCAKPATDNG